MLGRKTTSLLVLCLFLTGAGLRPAPGAQRVDQPPEYSEFRSIMRISDASVRLKELEKLVAANPQSSYLRQFEFAVIRTKVSMATDLTMVLGLQKQVLDSVVGFDRLAALIDVAEEVLEHPRLADFETKSAAEAALDYSARGLKLAGENEFLKEVPEEARPYIPMIVQELLLTKAKAYLLVGNAAEAAQALEDFKTKGGKPDRAYAYVTGKLFILQGKGPEALEQLMLAAAENYQDSLELARGLYVKTTGSTEGFDARLEARQRELPFHVQPFQAGSEWRGKAVLLELFTGSECPPCVAADLGVDGLLEAFDIKYLAVLEYHLPIPRPDPMMNHATQRRADRYGVNSTPSIYFDGQAFRSGGGPRSYAEQKFLAYADEVKKRLSEDPGVKLSLSAALKGDSVSVAYTLDKVPAGADLHFALGQEEEKYRGGNGILFHKMVVREFITLDTPPKLSGGLAISLTAAEAAAMKHVSDYELLKRFTFPEKHSAISRRGLRVIMFVQDNGSNKIMNVAVAPVK